MLSQCCVSRTTTGTVTSMTCMPSMSILFSTTFFFDVLSFFLCRKKDLMDKFQSDNKSFSAERVEEEVDRFMMDAESVNMYIKYLKQRKLNPRQAAAEALEAELSITNPRTVR